MAIAVSVAALVTGIIAGSWMWVMTGWMATEVRHMSYGYPYMNSALGMTFVVGPFFIGGIFGGLVAWFYNLIVPGVSEVTARPQEPRSN